MVFDKARLKYEYEAIEALKLVPPDGHFSVRGRPVSFLPSNWLISTS